MTVRQRLTYNFYDCLLHAEFRQPEGQFILKLEAYKTSNTIFYIQSFDNKYEDNITKADIKFDYPPVVKMKYLSWMRQCSVTHNWLLASGFMNNCWLALLYLSAVSPETDSALAKWIGIAMWRWTQSQKCVKPDVWVNYDTTQPMLFMPIKNIILLR